MIYEWDDQKNEINQAKHGVSFEDVISIFSSDYLIKEDLRIDYKENRYIAYGKTINGRLIVITHTVRNGNIRIISARKANYREQKMFIEKEKANEYR